MPVEQASVRNDRFAAAVDSAEVVLVHDYLNQRGGAERVVLELAQLWPDAPIYTSLYRPESTFSEFAGRDVHTTWMNQIPVDRHFRTLFPLYPAAFWSLGPIDADIVLSSSSGWAHGVRTSKRAFHAVYCYTPARWLWGEYAMTAATKRAIAPATALLRRWDVKAARKADLHIAISELSRKQIRLVYGREAPIVYPPVDTLRFTPGARGDRLLCVSRLLAHKRLDLLVRAANRIGIGHDIVGVGPALAELRALAGPTVTFHGRLDDAAVTELFENCRAYCLPGREEFGISPVEAHAAGKPVIAFADGGALETVKDGVSGVFFHKLDVESVVDAIARCDRLDASPQQIAALASRFSVEAFRRNLKQTLGLAWASRNSASR